MLPIEPIIPITSREYKFMLLADRFAGNSNLVESVLRQLCDAIKDATKLQVKGNLVLDKERNVCFLDLPDHDLYKKQNYVLRMRNQNNETSLTLKCRHGDRYFVQSQVVDAKDSKFEEDIKPRFTHLFSFSRKKKSEAPANFDTLLDLFPDLKNRIPSPNGISRLELVRNFTAIENVYSGLKVKLSNSFDAECAVIIWYDLNASEGGNPVVAEFSFRYPRTKWRAKPPVEPLNAFDGHTGLVAYNFFTALQDSDELKDIWLDPESKTKTRFAYEG